MTSESPAHAALRPYVVAMTGGIAAGKSTVARCFEAFGIGVHDADVAARDVVAPGGAALAEIESVFGSSVLDATGALDRRAMRERVFADAGAREQLERIIHPRVRTWLQWRADRDRGPYCVLAIPLLAENRAAYAWVDRVLLVDAPEPMQLERLMRRDGIAGDVAQRMLAAQASRAQRLAIADDVIRNDGDEAALQSAVATLHTRYLALAAAK